MPVRPLSGWSPSRRQGKTSYRVRRQSLLVYRCCCGEPAVACLHGGAIGGALGAGEETTKNYPAEICPGNVAQTGGKGQTQAEAPGA